MDIFLDLSQKKKKKQTQVSQKGDILHSLQKKGIAIFSRNTCHNWASCSNDVVKLSF